MVSACVPAISAKQLLITQFPNRPPLHLVRTKLDEGEVVRLHAFAHSAVTQLAIPANRLVNIAERIDDDRAAVLIAEYALSDAGNLQPEQARLPGARITRAGKDHQSLDQPHGDALPWLS